MVRNVLLAALFLPSITCAQVIVTEIMYDLAEGSDTGREWIEVYNTGTAPVLLSELTLFESNRKHTFEGNTALSPQSFAVIADKPEKFRADHPNYAGLLFDSAFSLNNTGESIEIRRGDAVLDVATYTKSLGGNGSGESLQNISLSAGGPFAPGAPTPGAPIPASGLARLAPPVKAKAVAKTAPTASAPDVLGAATTRPSFEPFTIPQGTPRMSLWLLGIGAIAGVSITGAILGRRRDELDGWTIIEET